MAQKVELLGKSGRFLPVKAFYDLNPVGKRHWSSLEFIEHVDPVTRRPLQDPENYRHIFIPPSSNIKNLAEGTVEELSKLPPRQRKRFFLGEYSDEIEGALWTFETLERARIDPSDLPKTLRSVVVAVDPSGTSGNEDTRSDSVGIVVAARGDDGIAYVLADRTCNLPPEGWGRVVVTAYHEFKADHIIGEANFGGDMVRATLHSVDKSIPYRPVVASRGKAVRAEPVSALYGHTEPDGKWVNDRVRHAGQFYELEGEMLDFSSAGYVGMRSPNRADALVWTLTDIMLTEMKGGNIFELMRRRAAGETLEEIARRPVVTPTDASGETAETAPAAPSESLLKIATTGHCVEQIIFV